MAPYATLPYACASKAHRPTKLKFQQFLWKLQAGELWESGCASLDQSKDAATLRAVGAAFKKTVFAWDMLWDEVVHLAETTVRFEGTRFLVRHCILWKFREIAPVF